MLIEMRLHDNPRMITMLDGRADGLRPALRHVAHATIPPDRVVLFIHGATFPSALSFAYPLDGRSWMDDIAAAGFDAWALDFIGYGEADRWPATSESAPLGRAADAATQIAQAIECIRRRRDGVRIAIVAHSWGTVPAGVFVAAHPDAVSRLVLYGPLAPRNEPHAAVHGALRTVTRDQQWQSFLHGVPDDCEPPFERSLFDAWITSYVEQVPSGPAADSNDIASGAFPYDPAAIEIPVLIARGEWDAVTSAADVDWLFASLTSAPDKRMISLREGTHRYHLERNRRQLYRAVQTFLEEID